MSTDPRRGARPVLVGAAALGLLLVEGLRAWLPTMLLAGDVAAGPGPAAAALALAAPAVAAVLGAAATARLDPRPLWVAGGVLAVVGQLGLVLADGGSARRVAAALAVVGAGLALTALAAGTAQPRVARTGVLAGAAGAAALHAALGTLGLGARPGPAAAAAAAVLVAAAGWAMARASRELGRSGAGAARPWLAIGPSLVLLVALLGPPGRVATATGWTHGPVAVTTVALQAVVVVAAMLAPRTRTVAAAAAALALVGAAGALGADAPSAVVAQVVLALGVGLGVGALDDVGAARGRVVRAAAAGAALVGTTVLLVVPVIGPAAGVVDPGRASLLVTALAHGGAVVLATRYAAVGPGAPRALLVRAAATSVLVALVAGGAAARLGSTTPAPRPPDAPTVTVLGADVHLGLDDDGRVVVPEVAALVRDLGVDVAVLTSVERGRPVTGSHDVAAILERATGMTLVFAPGADEARGNAVLTRLPVVEVVVERLPREQDRANRSALAVVLALPDGGQVAVVAAQLAAGDDLAGARLTQAQAVAALAARMRERGLPTVVAGDLGAGPEDEALAALAPLLRGALPPWAVTHPAARPSVQRDHVLVSDDLEVVRARVLDARLSDHRFVLAELVRLAAEAAGDPGA